MFHSQKIGEILMQYGDVKEGDIERALQQQVEGGGRIGELLTEMKACSEANVVRALSQQLDIPLEEKIDIDTVDLDLLGQLSLYWSRENAILPLERLGDARVRVAINDPLDFAIMDQLRFILQREPEPVLVPLEPLRDAINTAFDRKLRMMEFDDGLKNAETRTDDQDDIPEFDDLLVGQESDDEAPVIRFVNGLFVRAVREKVSDIHIEPGEQTMHVRFRRDGVLHEVSEPPKRFQASIIARVKIMAGLNIAEKRLPQDGRIRIKLAGNDVDIRVATAPTSHGERITMRLLDKSNVLLDLEAIGMNPDDLEKISRLILSPHGIILVTGPTGSGKTTTLYSALTKINTPDKNILTVEDPVEYQLQGISQMQVNAKIDLTFARGLRSYLRHDPDVVMVGEIRDKETADVAIQASLTGHLVLSTIHTNDAAGAFTRLIDMGVEPFLVASSLEAALAQRLVRRLCKHCKEPYMPTASQLAEIGLTVEDVERVGGHIHRAVGCSECAGLGYSGRVGIYELLIVDDEIQGLVMRRSDAGTIKKAALRKGMRTLRDDGALKVLSGATSIEEVLRVTQEDNE
ncbi:MAG: type II secretion system ATPase GspE [Myxococcota bacterium]